MPSCDLRTHGESHGLRELVDEAFSSVERKLGALSSLPLGMRRMRSLEGMDMDLETVSCVWNTHVLPDPNLVDLQEEEEEEEVEGGRGEGLVPRRVDLSFGLL